MNGKIKYDNQNFGRVKRDWNEYNETYLTLLVTIINKQLFKKNIRLKENQYNRKRKGKCVVLKIYDFFIFENYNAKKYAKSHFNIVLCFTLLFCIIYRYRTISKWQEVPLLLTFHISRACKTFYVNYVLFFVCIFITLLTQNEWRVCLFIIFL